MGYRRKGVVLTGMTFVVASLTVVGAIVRAENAFTSRVQAANTDWVSIFNGKNLDGWYTYLESSGKNNDPKGIFKVEDGMIHIFDIPASDEKQWFGYVATEKEYSNCRLRVEYKWGIKQFDPRTPAISGARRTGPRDSGLFYNLVGPDKFWPRLIEAQIMEGNTGDMLLLSGVFVTTTVESKGNATYKEGGVPYTNAKSDIWMKKSAYYERPGWNTVEVILDGDTATHLVNGKVTFRAWNVRQPDPQNPAVLVPLTGGGIALQAEGSEVYYRHIQVRPLVK